MKHKDPRNTLIMGRTHELDRANRKAGAPPAKVIDKKAEQARKEARKLKYDLRHI